MLACVQHLVLDGQVIPTLVGGKISPKTGACRAEQCYDRARSVELSIMRQHPGNG